MKYCTHPSRSPLIQWRVVRGEVFQVASGEEWVGELLMVNKDWKKYSNVTYASKFFLTEDPQLTTHSSQLLYLTARTSLLIVLTPVGYADTPSLRRKEGDSE